jgi:hypothetical protein
MFNRCAFLCGDRGSGKSTTLFSLLMAYLEAAVGSALVIDPPGTLVEMMLAYGIARGLESRVFIAHADPRKAKGKYLQWPLLHVSTETDPLVRQNEDDAYIEELLTGLFGLRGEKDGTNKPYTDKFARLALRIVASITPRPRIDQVLHLFDRDSAIGRAMLDRATDRDAVDQWRDAMARAGNGKQWEMETGASDRLLRILEAAAIFPHDGNSLDIEQAILNKSIILLDLSGVPPTHGRALGVNAQVAFGNANKRLFDRTRILHPHVTAVDELGAMRFDTPYLISSMREDRKYGTSWWLATQTLNDIPPEHVESILGLSDHYWHNMSSGVDRASADICDKAFSATEIFQTRDRALHDGWEDVSTTSESTNQGLSKHIEKEKMTSKNESATSATSVSHGYRAKYKIVTDVTYKTWSGKRDETKAELTNLPIGHFYYRGMSRWDKGHTLWPEDAWTFQTGLVVPAQLPDSELFTEPTVTRYEWQMRRAIHRIRSRPQYQPPQPLWTQDNDNNSVANPTVFKITPTEPRRAAQEI